MAELTLIDNHKVKWTGYESVRRSWRAEIRDFHVRIAYRSGTLDDDGYTWEVDSISDGGMRRASGTGQGLGECRVLARKAIALFEEGG